MLTTLLPAAADAAVPTTGQIFWSEFLGTAILLLLGGGVVATNLLPKSKGKGGGWLLINWGWGLAVFAGVYVAFRTGGFVGMAGFGASGPEQALFEHFGITPEAVAAEVRKRL